MNKRNIKLWITYSLINLINRKIIQKTENKTNQKDGKSEDKIVSDLNNNEQLNLITVCIFYSKIYFIFTLIM